MQTVSIYVRLSKAASERNLSLSGMLNECRAAATREGFEIVAEHVDDGVSGAIRNRPGFRSWLDDAATGRADVLLTFHADRLTREGINVAGLVLDTVEGKDPWTGAVVRDPVRFLDTKGLDSENGDAFRIMFAFASEAARAERNASQRRNLDTQRRLRDAGRFTGGAIPYGTRVEVRTDEDGREGRYLVEEPEEADRLRQIASRIIRGDSLRAVTAFVAAQGWTTRRGYTWQRTSLRGTLLSEPSRRYVFDASTYKALRARLTANGGATRAKSGRPSTFLLLGLLACSGCGERMTSYAYTAKTDANAQHGRRRRAYTCRTRSTGIPCPEAVQISAEAAERAVEERFLARFGRFEHMEPRVMLSGGEDLNAAEEAVQGAEAALLADLTPENLIRVQEARHALASAQARPVQRETLLVSTGKTMAEVWAESQTPERTALLSDVLGELVTVLPARDFPTSRKGKGLGVATLHPDRLVIRWRGEGEADNDYAA
jgi:site-specific DNA recombinase